MSRPVLWISRLFTEKTYILKQGTDSRNVHHRKHTPHTFKHSESFCGMQYDQHALDLKAIGLIMNDSLLSGQEFMGFQKT